MVLLYGVGGGDGRLTTTLHAPEEPLVSEGDDPENGGLDLRVSFFGRP